MGTLATIIVVGIISAIISAIKIKKEKWNRGYCPNCGNRWNKHTGKKYICHYCGDIIKPKNDIDIGYVTKEELESNIEKIKILFRMENTERESVQAKAIADYIHCKLYAKPENAIVREVKAIKNLLSTGVLVNKNISAMRKYIHK